MTLDELRQLLANCPSGAIFEDLKLRIWNDDGVIRAALCSVQETSEPNLLLRPGAGTVVR